MRNCDSARRARALENRNRRWLKCLCVMLEGISLVGSTLGKKGNSPCLLFFYFVMRDGASRVISAWW